MATYVITGGTRGIGRRVADALAGDDLLLVGRNAEALAAVCSQLPSARPVVADLAQPAALAAALQAGKLPDRVDGLVHSAGVDANGRLSELDPHAWMDALTVNVVAVAELTRILLPALRVGKATVVMVNSGAGRAVRRQGGTAYAASKHALVALADGLRLEEADLRVTTVFPGRTATEMQQGLRAYEGGEYRPEEYVDPATLAQVIAGILRLPADAVIPDVAVVPNT